MNIKKAIEILNQCLSTWEPNDQTEVQDAFRLGIEALKRIKSYRARSILDELDTLPGETEE